MKTTEVSEIARDWVKEKGHFSDVTVRLDEVIEESPKDALRIIEEIHHLLISCEPRDIESWALLAALPLENLLAKHGEVVIEEVEIIAKNDAELRKLLSGVWQNEMSDELFGRVQGLSDPGFRFP